MSNEEVMDIEQIFAMFEKMKGRPATPEERAELAKRRTLPVRNGIPSLVVPPGTGFGITGIWTKGPKKAG